MESSCVSFNRLRPHVLVLMLFCPASGGVCAEDHDTAVTDPMDAPASGQPLSVDDAFAALPNLDDVAPLETAVANGTAGDGEHSAGAASGEPVVGELSLLGLIDKGGVVGYLIIVVSIISLALIIDYLVTIRRARILPQRDLAMLRRLIEEQRLDQIETLDKRSSSYVTRVTVAGLREVHLGYDAMIKAMEDASEALASGIARKTEHLNVIGSICPMLGLLGTVIGMLRVFNEIASTAGAIEPQQLAGGIFEALITTCLGLIVAIPALYCYAIFRNRVDEYTGEASLAAERLVAGFKRAG